MDKKMKYVCLAMAMILGNVAIAQNTNQDKTDLNKNITLEREFDPVKKTVVKKTVLPKEIKNVEKNAVAPQFSDWAVPTIVPVEIPMMEPYGYRTRHNFSNQRGYLFIGGGTRLNMVAGAGYRAIDKTNEKLSVWMLHNSTWLGKNTTKLIEQPSQRQKQRFNDNIVGANWMKELNAGTLAIDGQLHFDSFNYYGGFSEYLKDHKTAFFEARADGKWQSEVDINGDKLDYEANATIDYAGYDKSHLEGIDGSKEFWLNASVESGYELDKIGDVGMLFGVDVVNMHRHDEFTNKANDKTYAMLTLSPYYLYENDIFKAKAGLNLNVSFNDGAAIRLSPNVDLNFKITKGVNLFVQATGGKTINHLGDMHNDYRYNDPLAQYGNTYMPFDGLAGFNVGPFAGFSAKIYAGYGFETGCLDAVVPAAYSGIYKDLYADLPRPDGNTPYFDANQYAAAIYKMTKWQGWHMGVELAYKYRSLAEAKMKLAYAPAGDEDYVNGMRYKGYSLGNDGATSLFNLEVTAWPIKPLMVTLGFDYRGNRSALSREWVYPILDDETGETLLEGNYYRYGTINMKDVANLYVGARYNFSHIFSVWAQANNLLCKQWDVLPGQGAQKIGLMGGISLNF